MVDQQIPLAIITPCFNEQEAIPHLAETLAHFQQNQGAIFDITYIFVDDGSSDRTWELLNRYFPPSDKQLLLRHAQNQGIGGAIISGFQAVDTEYVAVIDSDCTFHPDQLADMMQLMAEDVDVVTSSPLHAAGQMRDVPRWRQAMSYGAAHLYRLVLRQQLSSYTSCFRIFRSRLVADMRLSNYGFCGVTEILARLDMQGARIAEFPAVLGSREYGRSKINTLRTVVDHLQMVGKIVFAKWLGVSLKDLPVPDLKHGG